MPVNPSVSTITAPTDPVTVGGSFTLSVSSTGESGYILTYQWYLNDIAINGATLTSYSVLSAKGSDAGAYKVRVSYVESVDTFTDSNIVNVRVPVFTSVIPDVDPCGDTVPSGSGSGVRYFGFSFNTGSASNVHVYATTNGYAVTEEQMIRLYTETNSTNLLNSSTVTNLSDITLLSSNQLQPNSNLNGLTRNAIFNLSPNTTYYFIMKTTYNDKDPDADVAFSFEQQNGAQIPLIYYSTKTELELDGTISPFIGHAFTNIIPDKDPSGGSANMTGSGLRYFGFSFTPSASQINAFIRTNSYAATEELLVNIYKADTSSNLLNSISIPNSSFTIQDPTTKALKFPISFTNSSSTPNFTLSDLDTTATYYIIAKTSYNDSGEDVGIAFETTIGTQIPLTYYSTQTFINNDGTISPFIGHAFTNIIPDVNPSGGSAISASSTTPRYFGFSFTPIASQINAFIRTNSIAATDELLVNIYKADTSSNLLNIISIPNSSITTQDPTTKALKFPNSFTNSYSTPNFTLSDLDTTATYYIIARTTSNSAGEDIGLALETSNSTPISLTYYSTQLFINTDGTIAPFIGHAFTNIIPDVDLAGGSATDASTTFPRYFGFSFKADTTVNAFIRTNSTASTTDSIINLYKAGDSNNLITNISNMFNATLTGSVLTFPNSFENSSSTPNFVISGLEQGATYYIIARTTSNSTGEDIGLALETSNSTPISLTYYSTQLFINTDGTIAPFSSHLFTNIIPDKDPSGGSANMTDSGLRYFGFSFNASESPINAFIRTNQYANNEELLVNIYKAGTTTNLLNGITIPNTTITIKNPSTNSLKFLSSFTNSSTTPNFILSGLEQGATYYIVARTIFNDNTNTTTEDVGLALKTTSGASISLPYFSTSRVLNLDGTIPSFPQATVTHTYTEIIPNKDPSNGTISSNIGSSSIPRYFLWSFNTDNNNRVNIFADTSNTTGDSMLSLYKSGSTENLLGTKLRNPSEWVLQDATTKELTFRSQTYTNNTSTPTFGFVDLEPNTTYKFVMKTTSNNTTKDIAVALEKANGDPITLTYEATSTTMLNTAATFKINGVSILNGGSYSTISPSVTVAVTSSNSLASSIVSGNTSLAIGNNTVTVVVTAADGFTRATSTFTVVRSRAPAINPTITKQDITGKSIITFAFKAVEGATNYKLFNSNNLSSPLIINSTQNGDTINIIYEAVGYKGTSTLFFYLIAYDNTNTNTQISESQQTPLIGTIPCLPCGTRVLTPNGYRLVEEFNNGDFVVTDDGRSLPVIVHRSGTPCSDAKSAPVQIAARSFFGEYPVAPIRVSSWHAFKVGPGNQWLLPKDVIGINGVVQEPFGQAVEYYHFELPNFFTDNLVLEGGAVVESYGIPWILKNNLWGKEIFKMDKVLGYATRRNFE